MAYIYRTAKRDQIIIIRINISRKTDGISILLVITKNGNYINTTAY